MLEGDLWGSIGDVGECRLRRDVGLSFDLTAVRRRIASCRFIEGTAAVVEEYFFVGEMAVDEDAGGGTADWDLGGAGCMVIMTGGEVDVGEVMIRDFLMGF